MTATARIHKSAPQSSKTKREQLLLLARQRWVETSQLDMGALAQELEKLSGFVGERESGSRGWSG